MRIPRNEIRGREEKATLWKITFHFMMASIPAVSWWFPVNYPFLIPSELKMALTSCTQAIAMFLMFPYSLLIFTNVHLLNFPCLINLMGVCYLFLFMSDSSQRVIWSVHGQNNSGRKEFNLQKGSFRSVFSTTVAESHN